MLLLSILIIVVNLEIMPRGLVKIPRGNTSEEFHPRGPKTSKKNLENFGSSRNKIYSSRTKNLEVYFRGFWSSRMKFLVCVSSRNFGPRKIRPRGLKTSRFSKRGFKSSRLVSSRATSRGIKLEEYISRKTSRGTSFEE